MITGNTGQYMTRRKDSSLLEDLSCLFFLVNWVTSQSVKNYRIRWLQIFFKKLEFEQIISALFACSQELLPDDITLFLKPQMQLISMIMNRRWLRKAASVPNLILELIATDIFRQRGIFDSVRWTCYMWKWFFITKPCC